ncbi:hypothetical protein [Actinomadura rudentiformis]|uniref:Tyr recombinase domain-containing protein n=1 Tax=Actinomadura rudentiformis TaxID=359158 RepID=A0A6H9Z7R4_9ACTN|nr:hypothetical protein [Actinomadura rudentiformis]KAB2350016.1 hypothetical protein F8566_09285 [Actinomadura rudentiformis]
MPVLPVLVAAPTRPGEATPNCSRPPRPAPRARNSLEPASSSADRVLTSGSGARVWSDDPSTGERRYLTQEEHRGFWTWTAVEILRHTGIRIEELTELSHHSCVQYTLTTRELIPLLHIAPSKTDTERLLVISPELADVLSAIVRRIRGSGGAVPLVIAYDNQERLEREGELREGLTVDEAVDILVDMAERTVCRTPDAPAARSRGA